MGSPPFALAQIDHIVLRVRDGEAMSAFYCDVLGCSIERRQDAIGLLQLRAGKSLIDLVPVDGKLGRMGGAAPGAEGRNLDHVCLRVEPFDLDAIQAHLRAHGVAIGDAGPRYGAEGEGPSQYLSDPEGNVVELKGPPDSVPVRVAMAADPMPGPSAVGHLGRILQREPVLLVTLAYLLVSALGLWASYWFYARFGIPILAYMQPADLLVAGLRDPWYLAIVLAAAAFAWLVNRPQWLHRHDPVRYAQLRTRWWWRLVLAKDPAWLWNWMRRRLLGRFGWNGFSLQTGLALGIAWVTLWFTLSYVTARAQDIREGNGDRVLVTMAGASLPLAGEGRLLGTTSGYVFVYWPGSRRAEAISAGAIGRVRSLPGNEAPGDGQVRSRR